MRPTLTLCIDWDLHSLVQMCATLHRARMEEHVWCISMILVDTTVSVVTGSLETIVMVSKQLLHYTSTLIFYSKSFVEMYLILVSDQMSGYCLNFKPFSFDLSELLLRT